MKNNEFEIGSKKPTAKGSYVLRSTYQKVCEENKRLKKDIHILVMPAFDMSPEKTILISEWRNKFGKDIEFNKIMKEYAQEYLRQHPEEDFVTKNKICMCELKLDRCTGYCEYLLVKFEGDKIIPKR